MAHRPKSLLLVAGLACLVATPANGQHAPFSPFAKDFKQCRSGGYNTGTSGRGPCVYEAQGNTTGWVEGGINSAHALYRMGDFVPFRLVLRGLAASTEYRLRFGYYAVSSGLHTYDYVGSYNGSVAPRGLLTQVTPCGGVGDTGGAHRCGQPPSTRAVPEDSRTTFPNGSHPPLSGADARLSAWGATLTGISYVDPSRTQITVGSHEKASRELDVEFGTPADGHTVVLAWGGHIASPLDWGYGTTYGERGSGSAGFHVFLRALYQVSGPSYNLGSEEKTMNQNAIAKLESFSTRVAATSVDVGQPVVDTATLRGPLERTRDGRASLLRLRPCGVGSRLPPRRDGGQSPERRPHRRGERRRVERVHPAAGGPLLLPRRVQTGLRRALLAGAAYDQNRVRMLPGDSRSAARRDEAVRPR